MMGRLADAVRVLFGRTTQHPQVEGLPDLPEWLIGQIWYAQAESLEHIEAFEKVPMVHALVRRLADDAAALPRLFHSGSGDDRKVLPERHPLVSLWANPNPRQTGYELERDLFANFELHNESFLFLDRGKGARETAPVQRIWSLPSHLVEVVESEQRVVQCYMWNRGGVREELEPWKIVHLRGFNPKDEPKAGAGWLQAAKEGYEAQYHALRLLKRYYLRGGWVPGVWEPTDPNTKLDDPMIERMRERWRKGFQNVDTVWDLKVIQGMKQTRGGQTIAELKLDEMIALVDANLCRLAGVPPWMIGIKEGSSLAGSGPGTDAVAYWSNTLPGRTKLMDAVLSVRVCRLFGDGLSCETDYSGVSALQQARLAMTDAIVKGTGGPYMSENEGRSIGQLPRDKRPEADEVREPAPAPSFGGADPAADDPADKVQPETPAKPAKPEKSEHALRARMSREQMRKVQDRMLARYEKRVAAWWREEVGHQTEQALERFEEQARRNGMDLEASLGSAVRFAINPDDLVDEPDEAMEKRAQALFERLLVDRAEEVAAQLGLEAVLDVTAARWQHYVSQRADRLIVGTTETTRAQLRERLGQALAEQKPYSEMVAIVRDAMKARENMAQTIARTETHGPYNAAALEVWVDAGVPGKSWMTLHDDAVRESHVAAEAQGVIPISQPFQVGNGLAMYPGESGLAEEDINCRCVVVAEDEVPVEQSWWPSAATAKAFANGHANGNRVAALPGARR